MHFDSHNNSRSITNIRIFLAKPLNYAMNSIAMIMSTGNRHSLMLHGKYGSLVVGRDSSPHVGGCVLSVR
jgi:hypothetical protein